MPALSEPFVPGRGRRVALAAAGISVGLFGVVAWLLPGPDEGGDWRLGDRLMMWGLGLAIAALMARYARIGAWPFASGLRVRNLLLTREIPWAEIEDVRFGGGVVVRGDVEVDADSCGGMVPDGTVLDGA